MLFAVRHSCALNIYASKVCTTQRSVSVSYLKNSSLGGAFPALQLLCNLWNVNEYLSALRVMYLTSKWCKADALEADVSAINITIL